MYNAPYNDCDVKVYQVLHYNNARACTCLFHFEFDSKRRLHEYYVSYDSEYYIVMQVRIFIIYTKKRLYVSKYDLSVYVYIYVYDPPPVLYENFSEYERTSRHYTHTHHYYTNNAFRPSYTS